MTLGHVLVDDFFRGPDDGGEACSAGIRLCLDPDVEVGVVTAGNLTFGDGSGLAGTENGSKIDSFLVLWIVHEAGIVEIAVGLEVSGSVTDVRALDFAAFIDGVGEAVELIDFVLSRALAGRVLADHSSRAVIGFCEMVEMSAYP